MWLWMVMYGDGLRWTLISWESCNKPLDVANLKQGLDYTMCLCLRLRRA